MAAFCTCCGAVITVKSERCLLCGAPRQARKVVSMPVRQAEPEESSSESESKNRLSIA